MTQWKRIHFIEQIIAGDLSIQAAYDISSWNTWYWWFLPLSNLKVDCYNCMTSKITNVSRKENPTAQSIRSTKAEEEVHRPAGITVKGPVREPLCLIAASLWSLNPSSKGWCTTLNSFFKYWNSTLYEFIRFW